MKKIILTGIQPSGELHIGNYLGVIKDLLEYQKKYKVYLMIADLHAQTVLPSADELAHRIYDLASSLIALGIDPNKTILFQQSQVPQHTQLAWVLSCLTPIGDLLRMHQFKEKKQQMKKDLINAGLLIYPILQASDILLYNPDYVPVGKDQEQHLELTREIARRFNQRYEKVFKIPETLLFSETQKIMSLDDPSKKMSKSKPEGMLGIFEKEELIISKIKKAVTDSERKIKYDPKNKPAISNLMVIYKYLTKKTFAEIEKEFENQGYREFKEKIISAFLNYFKKARMKKQKLSRTKIEKILFKNSQKAQKVAQQKLTEVYQVVGFWKKSG